jgi:quinoprotein glucose dehydrogenase
MMPPRMPATSGVWRDGVSHLNQPAPPRSIWSGVYTEEQAIRGETTYARYCEECHQGDLLGFDYNPALVGQTFSSTWNGRTVADLFLKTQQTMPKTAAGTLLPQEYADVLSYLFKVNGLPAGEAELPTEVKALVPIVIGARSQHE